MRFWKTLTNLVLDHILKWDTDILFHSTGDFRSLREAIIFLNTGSIADSQSLVFFEKFSVFFYLGPTAGFSKCLWHIFAQNWGSCLFYFCLDILQWLEV